MCIPRVQGRSVRKLSKINLIEDNSDIIEILCYSDRAIQELAFEFNELDADSSGEISREELLQGLSMKTTSFTNRVFAIFDEDGSGEIDFREFIVALWNYCTLSKATLIYFAFDLYDEDKSGIIDSHEVSVMCRDLYGPSYEKNKLAKNVISKVRLVSALSEYGEALDIEKFARFCNAHPALLYPAFRLQRALQKRFLGIHYWKRMSNKRVEVGNGQYTRIEDILQKHYNKRASEAIKLTNGARKKTKRKSLETLFHNSGIAAKRRLSKFKVSSKSMSTTKYIQNSVVRT